MATNNCLSANQWTSAKLYDKDHPQLGVDELMDEEDFKQAWSLISTCGLPATREESANGKIPLWEEVQSVVNKMIRKYLHR